MPDFSGECDSRMAELLFRQQDQLERASGRFVSGRPIDSLVPVQRDLELQRHYFS
jgi:hypothetical protein